MTTANAPKRILVVDDEDDILKMVGRRLQSWGYEVVTASDGMQGVELALTHRPALILLDIMMPKLKGRDVCAILKANPNTQDIPVIFLTALGLPDHIKAGLDLGADDYLMKPFKPEELKDRIRVCLLRHNAHAATHANPSTSQSPS